MARERGEPIDRGRRDNPAIKDLASEVFDNGRRGAPKPGCDCVQCFGYCMVDQDAYAREIALRNERPSVDSIALELA